MTCCPKAVMRLESEENTILYVIATHQRRAREPLPCTDGSSEATEVAQHPERVLVPNAAWGCRGDVLKPGRNETQYDSFIDSGCLEILRNCRRTSPGHPLPKAVGTSACGFPAALLGNRCTNSLTATSDLAPISLLYTPATTPGVIVTQTCTLRRALVSPGRPSRE